MLLFCMEFEEINVEQNHGINTLKEITSFSSHDTQIREAFHIILKKKKKKKTTIYPYAPFH